MSLELIYLEPTSFLVELRNIATNLTRIHSGLLKTMQKTPLLLGERRIKRIVDNGSQDPEYEMECNTLLRANEVGVFSG